jgi:hypothetical protein
MTDEEAAEIVRGIIHTYIGPDHRVGDMRSFSGALCQALLQAHQQGWKDRSDAEKLAKH